MAAIDKQDRLESQWSSDCAAARTNYWGGECRQDRLPGMIDRAGSRRRDNDLARKTSMHKADKSQHPKDAKPLQNVKANFRIFADAGFRTTAQVKEDRFR